MELENNANIYYTVTKLKEHYDGEEAGCKVIYVYYIKDGNVVSWFDLKIKLHHCSEEKIQDWLIDNGYEDNNYNFILL